MLLATANGSIYVVDKKESQDQVHSCTLQCRLSQRCRSRLQLLDNGPFSKMVVSPSGGLFLKRHSARGSGARLITRFCVQA